MNIKSGAGFYLGANTSDGFFSLYDRFIDQGSVEDFYVLKGGPGCKSDLLRYIADGLDKNGVTVEYIFSHTDPDSLDAVFLPELGTAVLNGSGTHIVEPLYPAVKGHYVDLEPFYDRGALKELRGEIIGSFDARRECFERAFRYLAAARSVAGELPGELVKNVSDKLRRRTKGIVSREIPKGSGAGRETRRLLGGVTCAGTVARFDTVGLLCSRVYELCDNYGLAHRMLCEIRDSALKAGCDVIACPSPQRPEYLEHVLIPELSLAFITSNASCPYGGDPYRRIRLDAMPDKDMLRAMKSKLRFSKKLGAALTEEAVGALREAKGIQDRLDGLYRKHTDTEGVRALAESLARTLMSK